MLLDWKQSCLHQGSCYNLHPDSKQSFLKLSHDYYGNRNRKRKYGKAQELKKKEEQPDVITNNYRGIKRKVKQGESILLVHPHEATIFSSNTEQSGCGYGQRTVCSSAPDFNYSSAGV